MSSFKQIERLRLAKQMTILAADVVQISFLRGELECEAAPDDILHCIWFQYTLRPVAR